MTKQVKIGILASAVWLIAISKFEVYEIRGREPDYGTDLFVIDYFAFGIIPELVSWVFWWIRKA